MEDSTLVRVLAVAAVFAFSGALGAQSNGKPIRATKSMTSAVRPTSERLSPSDDLILNGAQKSAAWKAITKQARRETLPPNFKAKVGAVMPNTLVTYPVPMAVSNKLPALRRYQYALLANNKLLIINPGDEKVAKVITHQTGQKCRANSCQTKSHAGS